MATTIYHVVPNNEEWAVKKEGGEQASRVAPTQGEAIEYAETFARRQAPSRVVVHDEDGKIESQHSFDADDRPSQQSGSLFSKSRVLTGLALAVAVGAGVGATLYYLRRKSLL